jgi:hypothetical protein
MGIESLVWGVKRDMWLCGFSFRLFPVSEAVKAGFRLGKNHGLQRTYGDRQAPRGGPEPRRSNDLTRGGKELGCER